MKILLISGHGAGDSGAIHLKLFLPVIRSCFCAEQCRDCIGGGSSGGNEQDIEGGYSYAFVKDA